IDRRLRRRIGAPRRVTACRRQADAGGRILARHARLAPHRAALKQRMPRYKLTIEYDGTPFVGWQVQDNGMSVQGVVADAVLSFAGERRAVGGAGRTDAGVHALGQVAHVDLAKDWPPDTVRDALNAHLRPHPVAVLLADGAADDFDARFPAR